MKKLFAVSFMISTIAAGTLYANPFDKFKEQLSGRTQTVAQKYLDDFSKDLGGVMGGGAFHQGKNLGMLTVIPGFDVGVHVPGKSVSSENAIMKAADADTIFMPIVQAEIGLPAGFDLIGRYSSYADATMTGFGLRYGIINNTVPLMPSLSVQGVHNMLSVKAGDNEFKATTTSALAMMSFNIPIVDPYIGAGYDLTSVEPGSGIPLPAKDMKGNASGYRVEAGLNLSFIPFTYLQLGAAMINGDMGYTAGLGVKF